MNARMLIGLVLAILGGALLGWQGVAYFTTREPVFQAGPFQVFGPVQHAIWLGPFIGGLVLVVGLILMLTAGGRRAN